MTAEAMVGGGDAVVVFILIIFTRAPLCPVWTVGSRPTFQRFTPTGLKREFKWSGSVESLKMTLY